MNVHSPEKNEPGVLLLVSRNGPCASGLSLESFLFATTKEMWRGERRGQSGRLISSEIVLVALLEPPILLSPAACEGQKKGWHRWRE